MRRWLILGGALVGILVFVWLMGGNGWEARLPASTVTPAFRPPVPTSAPGALPTLGLPLALPNPVATVAWLTAQALLPSPTPRPSPVAPIYEPYVVLYQDQQTAGPSSGFHGPPPFTFAIAGFISSDPRAVPGCRAWHWNWGDGSEEATGCQPISNGSYMLPGAVGRHTYTRLGTYTIEARAILTDGQELTGTLRPVIVTRFDPGAPNPIFAQALWIGSLIGTGIGLLVLWRRGRRWRRWGIPLLLLALWTVVPPFSFVPNPLGLIWNFFGGYSYDSRLPFVDRFVMGDDPTQALRGNLEGLLGQTGLDPLDPVQPLVGYEFQGVRLPTIWERRPTIPVSAFSNDDREATLVTTRLVYQDGSARTYDLPIYGFGHLGNSYRDSWIDDGLERLRTQHQEIEDIPFAGPDAPLHLGIPQRLSLPPAAQRLGTRNPANWLLPENPGSPTGFRLIWAPQGDAFLTAQASGPEQGDLWLVSLDGRPPVLVSPGVLAYDWSPDGRYIVYNVASPGNPTFALTRDGQTHRELARPDSVTLPGINRDGIWYMAPDALVLAPYDGGPVQRFPPLRDAERDGGVRPAPDGRRLAYRCTGGQLCLVDPDGRNWIKADTGTGNVAWSADGTRLVTTGVAAALVRRDGTIVNRLPALDRRPSETSRPQWTPDGRYIFVGHYPNWGRRIITVDVATGEAWDLTPPRWDPLFALAPDGHALLLTNGRGGFWSVAVTK